MKENKERQEAKTEFTNFVIGSTKDYEKFKTVGCNRAVKQRVVTMLMKSFKTTKGMLISKPIIVDRGLNVIDGQHRLEACKRMNIPVHYIITNDVIENIPLYNAYQEKWGLQDYAHYFANNGNKNYQRILEVSEKAGTAINGSLECIGIVTGCSFNDAFKEGRFLFDRDIDKCVARIEKIKQICYLVKGARGISKKITRAIRFLEKIKTFNLDDFIEKIKKYPAKIHGCGTSEEYIELFIDIYNHYRKKEESISAMDILVAKKITEKKGE